MAEPLGPVRFCIKFVSVEAVNEEYSFQNTYVSSCTCNKWKWSKLRLATLWHPPFLLFALQRKSLCLPFAFLSGSAGQPQSCLLIFK